MASDYERSAAKAVVAQTAEAYGFDGIQNSACEALSDLLLRYISEIGCLTHQNAEYAGRPDCNINDLLLAFQDMGVDMEELMEDASTWEDLPFAHTMPALPAVKQNPPSKSFKQSGEVPPAHIPDFLPAYPDKHNYVETAVFAAQNKDAREQKQAQLKAKKDAEKAIIHLSERERNFQFGQPEKRANLFLAPPEIEEGNDTRDPNQGASKVNGDGQQKSPYSPSSSWMEGEAVKRPKKQLKMLESPLQLDWRLPMKPSNPTELGFEDAFAEIQPEATEKGGRRRRQSVKSADDLLNQKAEQILAAGADAIYLDDGQPEGSTKR